MVHNTHSSLLHGHYYYDVPLNQHYRSMKLRTIQATTTARSRELCFTFIFFIKIEGHTGKTTHSVS